MKKIRLSSALLFLVVFYLNAQTPTHLRVYQLFQQKCVSCHDHASPEAGLDLQGTGATENARALNVYNKIYQKTPANAYAAGKGYQYIYPGRPDRSFLFRKVNNGLEPTIQLHADEKAPMPADNQLSLSNVEKELIRQWILFGAPTGTEVVEETLLEAYYNVGGMAAFPAGAPAAPPAEAGFQIKMGPFYLEPGGEIEFFQKYELKLPANLEVNRVDVKMGNFSHHFIIYDFNPGGSGSIPHGLRLNADHSNIGLVTAVQESIDLRLPQGTAFPWDKNLVLDLNSHYINYSSTVPYQAEVYVNVYTQPAGTAAQEMHSELIPNFNIPIPNNGDLIQHSQAINPSFGEIFVWGMMGHTHQYGTDYKVYKRLSNGQKGEMIYDASCPQGIPGCVSPFFDYRHIPMRYFEPLKPITINFSNGLIHEASWINDGPASVNFGPTSNDEMMVLIIMFTTDTTGIVSGAPDPGYWLENVRVSPNPARDGVLFQLPDEVKSAAITLFDLAGRVVRPTEPIQETTYFLERKNLPAGAYFYHITDREGRRAVGKLLLE